MVALIFIILGISLFGNIILWHWFRYEAIKVKTLEMKIQVEDDDRPLPEELYNYKYENVLLIIKTIPSDIEEIAQICDTSLYMSKHIIGLTIFVPTRDFYEMKDDATSGMEVEDDFEEEFSNLLEDTIRKNVAVYQLKSGYWVWRNK